MSYLFVAQDIWTKPETTHTWQAAWSDVMLWRRGGCWPCMSHAMVSSVSWRSLDRERSKVKLRSYLSQDTGCCLLRDKSLMSRRQCAHWIMSSVGYLITLEFSQFVLEPVHLFHLVQVQVGWFMQLTTQKVARPCNKKYVHPLADGHHCE